MERESDASAASAAGRLPSGRHNLPRKVVVQSQRERLLDSMLDVVAAKGYPATSVADVIGHAGVSRATFYELFDDKEDCFLAMYEVLTSETLSYVRRAFDTEEGWLAQAKAALEALLRFLSSHPARASVALVEALAAGDRARKHYNEAIDAFLPFVEMGQSVAPSGLLVPPTTPLVVVGGIMHTIHEQVAAGHGANLPRLLPDLLYITTVPYIGPEEALAALEEARREGPGLAL